MRIVENNLKKEHRTVHKIVDSNSRLLLSFIVSSFHALIPLQTGHLEHYQKSLSLFHYIWYILGFS